MVIWWHCLCSLNTKREIETSSPISEKKKKKVIEVKHATGELQFLITLENELGVKLYQ